VPGEPPAGVISSGESKGYGELDHTATYTRLQNTIIHRNDLAPVWNKSSFKVRCLLCLFDQLCTIYPAGLERCTMPQHTQQQDHRTNIPPVPSADESCSVVIWVLQVSQVNDDSRVRSFTIAVLRFLCGILLIPKPPLFKMSLYGTL